MGVFFIKLGYNIYMLKRSIDIRIFGLAFLLVVFLSIFLLNKTLAIIGMQALPNSGVHGWYGIDTSADGTKIIASDEGSGLYISNDSGNTWTFQTGIGSISYAAVDVTPDGTKFAAASGGYIYLSNDDGANWSNLTESLGYKLWYTIVLSDDGTHITASAGDGIWTSSDSGANWLHRINFAANWFDVDTSSNGQVILTACNGCQVQLSTDGGVSWSVVNDLGVLGWRSFTVSPDGTHLGAASPDGPIFTSDDGGTTWVNHVAALHGANHWLSLAASDDGQHLAAAIYSGGDIWTSDDGGTTWTDNTYISPKHWYAVTLSADGSKLYATANGDYIYASIEPAAPTLGGFSAQYKTDTSETLVASIISTIGSSTTIRGFEYGLTDLYGSNIHDEGIFGTGTYSFEISGLTQGATYHYRAYATNGIGTTYGEDHTFIAGEKNQISSCADFEAINTNSITLTGTYVLMNDLDCASEGNNIMVGTNDYFSGSFEGNNHTINVNINSNNSNVGLFSQISSATITNLNITGTVSGSSYVGSLVGYAQNYSNGNTQPVMTISNVHSTATVNATNDTVGGLIGYLDNEGYGVDGDATATTINNCSQVGNVSGGSYYVGGLIGYVYQDYTSSTNITNSYVEGDITSSGAEIGGLVGEFDQYDGNITITGNHYSGNITSVVNSSIGGLVGYLYLDPEEGYASSNVNISNNYTTGSVVGDYDIGGLFGYVYADNYQDFPLTITVENNHSTSDITSGYESGGLAGYFDVYNEYTNSPVVVNINRNYVQSTISSGNTSAGFFGYFATETDNIQATISESYFSGTLLNTGTSSSVGGFVGDMETCSNIPTTISNSYVNANINGYQSVGGLVGGNSCSSLVINNSYAKGTVTGVLGDSNSLSAGGLVGYNFSDVTINNSFSAVTVSDFAADTGTIIGINNSGILTNVVFDQSLNPILGCVNTGGLPGCTAVNTIENPNANYFVSNHTNTPLDNWNFSSIWRNKDGVNSNFPVLVYFYPFTIPTVTTDSQTNIDTISSILSGTIVDTGGVDVTARGFNYGSTTSYGLTTLDDIGTFLTGVFDKTVNGLACSMTYHYQAFAINIIGTGYGSDQTFTNSNCPSGHPTAPPAPPTPAPSPKPNPVPTPEPEKPAVEIPKPVVKIPTVVAESPTPSPTLNPTPVVSVSEAPSGPGSVGQGYAVSEHSGFNNGNVLQDSSTNTANNSIDRAITNLFGKNVVLSLSETKKTTKALIETPIGQTVTEIVPVVGAASGVAVSVAAGMFANPLTMSEIFLIPMRLWALLMTALGLKKRNRPWGTVYDSVTKQPLDPAYVVLLDQQGKEVATSITDIDGRYGFLVGPGTYHLIASKTNYTFPSTKLKGENIDELYNDLYFGTDVVVASEGEVIGKNIPLDANGFDWNEYTKKEQKLTKFYSNRQKWIAYISNILFSIGLLVTIIAVLVVPTSYNVGTLVMYLVLFILKRTILRPKPQGFVTDKTTNTPLSFAIVRIYSASTNREILHKVTDKTGKYYCLIPNGKYYATVERKNPDATYTKVYTSEPVEVTGGYFKGRFVV